MTVSKSECKTRESVLQIFKNQQENKSSLNTMVGNMNRKSKRIELRKEKKRLSKIEDTGERSSKINEDFMDSNVIDLFKNVWYYSSGILDEKVSGALEVGQAKLCPYLSRLCEYYIIGKNPNNMEIEEAIGFDVPAVSQDWVLGSVECGKLLPAAAFSFSPSKDQVMSGVRVCISGVVRPDACSIWAMVKFNGGQVDTLLTEASTHLVATSDQGKLYEEALARNDVFVVTPDWVTDSVRRKIKCIENVYHPRLIDTSGIKLIDTPQLAPTDQHSDGETSVVADYNPATLSKTSADMKRRPNLACFTNFFSMSSDRIENKQEEVNKLKEKDLKMRKVGGSLKKLRSNDSFQTSKGKEENQMKLISSVKRKLVEKENIGKVSKKLKWGKISKLSEMSNSTEGYSCQMCDKAFRKRWNLMEHIKTVHVGIRCQMCDKAFRKKWNLMEHIKTVHEGIRFPCPMCDLTASTKSNLRRHMAAKHNVQMRNIVHDNVQMVDSVNEDVIEETVTSHPNTMSSPAITHISHHSFHTPQLPEEKQNVKHDLPLLDTIKSYPNPIVKLSPQLKSSNCTQHHVRNGLQGEDLKQQEYPPNQPLKHHKTASVHNVLRHHAMHPLPKSKHLLASVPTTPENIKEISPVVRSWTVEETITQVSLLDQKLAPHVQIFRSHEIDGRALFLLTPEMMVKYLDMKLGPALKVGSIIEKLKTK